MWIDKLINEYKYTTSEIEVPKVDKPHKEYECDIDRLSKILPNNYFNVDLYREDPIDTRFLRKRGLIFIVIAIIMFITNVYSVYHCHKASCSDCLENLDKFQCDSCKTIYKDYTHVTKHLNDLIPHKMLTYLQHSDNNTCSLSYCVYNNFWNPSTHYEKCYYSTLTFNTLLWFMAMRAMRWLATVCFKHCLPAFIPED